MNKAEILKLLKAALAEIEATGVAEGIYFGDDNEIDIKLTAAIKELEIELSSS